MKTLVSRIPRAFLRAGAAGLIVVTVGCSIGDGGMSVEFDGRSYDAMASENFTLTAGDLTAVGEVTSADPRSAVIEATAYRVGQIPTDQLVAMRAAADQPADYLLFRDPSKGFPPELCEFANTQNPPSELDCPR
jgi:hypothetical protein